MDEGKLDGDMKNAIVAYFEGFELVEFMQVPVEVIVELLEDYILDNLLDISDEIGYNNGTDEDE